MLSILMGARLSAGDAMFKGERVEDYRDKFGAIVHADGDGGDSANRMSAYWTYLSFLGRTGSDYVIGRYDKDMDLLTVSPGRHRRHPDTSRWYSNPKNFSRDQSINMQSCFVLANDKTRMWNLVKARAARLFFHFNEEAGDDRPETKRTKVPDIAAPVEFAQFIRGLDLILFTPMLYVLDLQLLFDVSVVRPISRKQGGKDFDVQYLPLLISAQSKYSNFIVRAAIKEYAKQKVDVEAALERYFREGDGLNGLKPMGDLATEAYRELIKE